MTSREESVNNQSDMLYQMYTIQPVVERYKLSKVVKSKLYSMTPNFGFNGLGEFVFYRTYSRNGENWADVVIRVIEGVFSIRKDYYVKHNLMWDSVFYDRMSEAMALAMFNMEWLPPGRGLWMMGTDFVYTRGSMGLVNCAAVETEFDLVHSAEWAMDGLMHGVGVGFTTNWKGVSTRPDKTDTYTYVIPDSREGWVDSLIRLLISYVHSHKYGSGKFPTFDYSKIRPSGLPIKGFGGVSSGPDPLIKLHKRLEEYLDNFCQGYVTHECVQKPYSHTRLVADIFNAIGACVVAGNVRRCLGTDAMVHTRDGYVSIGDIQVGTEVQTRYGFHRVSAKFEQGVQKLIKITLQDGTIFRCTPNHRMAVFVDRQNEHGHQSHEFIEARALKVGDTNLVSVKYQEYSAENDSGSIFYSGPHIRIVSIEEDGEEETYDIEVEDVHEFYCNGLLTHNSAEICLGSVNDSDFINLKNYDMYPERGDIAWMSNNSVVLTEESDYQDFSYIPEMAKRICDNGEPGMINLYNIQKFGRYGKPMHDDATMVNPCGEIPLSVGDGDFPIGGELCNLAEVFPHRCTTVDRYYDALEYATLYTSTVVLLGTSRQETNNILAMNRRVGVSISGIAYWSSMKQVEGWGDMNYTKMSCFLRNGYKKVRAMNSKLAREAGIRESIRVTTIKPSGSISLLAGATPGVHYPVSRYAIRRVRVSSTSPLIQPLIDAGVRYEKDIYSDNTLVFEFVIDHGDIRQASDVSPWEQFSLVATLQRTFADNSVSATIYFDKEKDGPDVEKMLAMYIPVLKTVSLMPHSGHGYAQAPYQPLSKQEYDLLVNTYKMPDFSTVKISNPEGDKYCTNEGCL